MRQLRFEWPPLPEPNWQEEVFVGVWHPTAEIQVAQATGFPLSTVRKIQGRNWCLWGSISPFDESLAVVHDYRGISTSEHALAFKGYLTSPVRHTWSRISSSSEIRDELRGQPNGVFAAALIGQEGISLELQVDAFGVAPLYWRSDSAGTVFFATSPRYLRWSVGNQDPLAFSSVLTRGSVVGDLSIVPEVKRIPAGNSIRFDSSGVRRNQWFPFETLPPGDEPLSSKLLLEAEETFQAAMGRVTAVANDYRIFLPLSSGDDSRRILGALVQNKQEFTAKTIRILQQGDRDMDGAFTVELAHRFGFPHEVIEMADPVTYAGHDRLCRVLFSCEVNLHSWIVPLMKSLPTTASAIFDGLAGDALSNGAYVPLEFYEFHGSRLVSALTELLVPGQIEKRLRRKYAASIRHLRDCLASDVNQLPMTTNRSALALLLNRTRRHVGASSQHLIPAGNLVVYPYLDLDYINTAMRLAPKWKFIQSLQARCLERFSPELYRMRGSQRDAHFARTGSRGLALERMSARYKAIQREIGGSALAWRITEMFRTPYNFRSLGSLTSGRTRVRSDWWLSPLLMLEYEASTSRNAWSG